MRAPTNMTPEEAEAFFFANSRKLKNGCRQWLGAKSGPGYGSFQGTYLHRWVYEHFIGPIPDGYEVDHRCHNEDEKCPGGKCPHRLCCEKDHLDCLPKRDHRTRTSARKKFCRNGHPHVPENRYVRPDGQGTFCRICAAERDKLREKRLYNPEARRATYLRKKARESAASGSLR